MRTMKSAPQFSSARGQGGFTLIELVMVIVILGILSAFALPRFADVSADARVSTIKALVGSIKSAAAITHAKEIVTTGGTVTVDGNLVILMSNGYPTAVMAQGIGDAAGINTNDFTPTVGTNKITFVPKDKPAATTTCTVIYKESLVAGGIYDVAVDVSAC